MLFEYDEGHRSLFGGDAWFGLLACMAQVGGSAALALAAVTWGALCAACVSLGHSCACFPLHPLFGSRLRFGVGLELL